MNKIYRVVWNASLGAWVAVSEIAKGKTKSKVAKVAVSAAILIAVVGGMPAYAVDQTVDGNLTVNGNITVSGTVEGVDVANLNSQVNHATTGLATKASQAALDTEKGRIDTLNSTVNNATTGLATKASQAALDTEKGRIDTLNSTVNNATTGLATKASQAALDTEKGRIDTLNSTVNNTTIGLATKASQAALDTLADKSITFTSEDGSVNRKLGETLTIQGTGSNVNTSVSGNTLSVTLNNALDLTSIGSVTTGATKINNAGLTTTGAVSTGTLTTTGAATVGGTLDVSGGASLNNQKITSLGAGNVAAGSTDAVNGGQLYNSNVSIANALGTTVATDGTLAAPTYLVSDGKGSAQSFNNVKDAIEFITGANTGSGVGIKYFHANSTKSDSVANGSDSVAIGPVSVADGASSIAMGDGAIASADTSIAIGKSTQAAGKNSVSIGESAQAAQDNNVAIGSQTSAIGANSTAIGVSTGNRTITYDTDSGNTKIVSVNGIAVTATSTDPSSITAISGVVMTSEQVSQFLTALASGANIALGNNSLSAGTSTLATGSSSVALGDSSIATGEKSIAIGTQANANGTSGIAVGSLANAANQAVAIGESTSATSNAVAIGEGAVSAVGKGVSIGYQAGTGSVQGNNNDRVDHIAIGNQAGQNVIGNQNIAVGTGAGSNLSSADISSSDHNIAIGTDSGTYLDGDDNISIGNKSNSNSSNTEIRNSVALGSATTATSYSTVVGYGANAVGDYATVLGNGAKVSGGHGTALGADSNASSTNVALGSSSIATQNSTTASYLVSDPVGFSSYNIVSVGNAGSGGTITRRITNVAPGGDATDAVNVSQLTQLQKNVATILGTTGSTDTSLGSVEVNGTNYGSVTAALAAALNATGGGSNTLPADYYVTYTNADQKEIALAANAGEGTTITNVKTDATDTSSAANVAYVNDAVNNAKVKYVAVNSTRQSNSQSNQASGNDSLAIGAAASTSAVATNGIAVGFDVSASNTNSVALGSNHTDASGKNSIAIGTYTAAKDENNVAIGTNVVSDGVDSIVMGNNAQADSTGQSVDYAVVIGSNAEVQNAESGTAIGQKAKVKADNGVAIGNEAVVSDGAKQGIAVGRLATAAGENSAAIGRNSQASGNKAYAIGDAANVLADNATALGASAAVYSGATNANAIGNGAVVNSGATNANAIGNRAIVNTDASSANAIGDGAQVYATNTNAIGTEAKAKAKGSTALGTSALAGENAVDSTAIGTNAQVYASNANALGTLAIVQSQAKNGLALGANTTVTHENAVALGSSSVSGVASPTTGAVINGKTYSYAGITPTSTVSVGSVGNERQIINVAAGRVTANSTDAINGSQLFQTNTELAKVATDTAAALGGNASAGTTAGGITAPSYIITKTDGTTYTAANNVGTALSNLNAEVVKPLTFAADSGSVARTLGSTLNIKGGKTTDLTDNNIGVVASGDTLTVKLAKDINLGSTGSVTTGNTVVNNNGLVINNADTTKIVSVTGSGINAGNHVISNVASGGTTVTNAANIGDVQKASSTVVAGTNVTSVTSNSTTTGTTYAVNANGTTASAGSSAVTVTAGSKDTNNVTNYAVDLSASTKSDIQQGVDAKTATDKGLNFAVNGGAGDNVKLGDTVNFANGTNTTATYDAASNTYKYGLNDNITLTNAGSVTVGATQVDNSGVQAGTIKLDASTGKIKGVTAGEVSAISTEAVNGSQLYSTNQNVTTAQNAADTAQATADKGLNFAVNGGAGDNVKLGDTVNFANGTNTTAEYDAASNTYKYNLNDTITLTNAGSVTVGATKVDNSGV
ncbi:ESPR-type extended signal peptide-containing protein, partial [Acinetobacter puyangensis]|uniref:ESPR-type extended signal peptide-containing protein n=2 Tax=Acinetobacter puyangensis TaxID=1096779 RepID=UPI0036186260